MKCLERREEIIPDPRNDENLAVAQTHLAMIRFHNRALDRLPTKVPDDERFATHLARGEHQEEIEGIVAEWAGGLDAAEIDRVLNEAGVICGPIYTIADIFEDDHFRAREMLVEHEDPELGTYIGPGIVPKFSETPGEVRWSATWEEGSHNDEIYGELLGLGADERASLREDGVI